MKIREEENDFGFIGILDPLPFEWSADDATKYWGTKWGSYDEHIELLEGDTMVIKFDTAWSPPHAFYERMAEKGLSIEAFFVEVGCDYIGSFDSGTMRIDECSLDALTEVVLSSLGMTCNEPEIDDYMDYAQGAMEQYVKLNHSFSADNLHIGG